MADQEKPKESKPDPYKGAVDVTAQFDLSGLPVPGLKSFVSADDVMKGAEDTSYLGMLTDAEAKKLVRRSFTITKGTDMLLGEVANDRRFGYSSVSEVVRHFVELGLQYYKNHKAFLAKHDNFANDVLRQQAEMRLDAERARRRKELQENIALFEAELEKARMTGDFPYIAARFEYWDDMLSRAESETQSRLLREVLLSSLEHRASAAAFYQWTHARYRAPHIKWQQEWVKLSEDWMAMYEEK